MTLFKIFIAAILIDNVVLMRFLGLCPFIGMSSDEDKSIGMGIAVAFVMVLATSVTAPFFRFILEPQGLVFLRLIVFILVIASLVQLVEFYVKKSAPGLYSSMGVFLALMTTNCAILAVALDAIDRNYTFVESIVHALGTAIGFLLSLLLLAGIRKRIKTSPIPVFMKGTPILFIIAALLSLAFTGFSGVVKF